MHSCSSDESRYPPQPCGGPIDKLLLFLDQTVESGFLKPAHRGMLLVEERGAVLLERMRGYEAPRERKISLSTIRPSGQS